MYKESDFLQMNIITEYEQAKEINNMMNQANAPYGIEDPVKEDVNVKVDKVIEVKAGEIARPHLVLPIAGQPQNGTEFPKEEKLIWKEIKRVIDETVENMAKQGNFRLLIPIWNKFDLEYLRSAEKHNVPVTFILPSQSWGESRLPKFQTDLVVRMKSRKENKVVVHRGKNYSERVHQAIKVSDLILGLDNGNGMQQFYETIRSSNAVAKPFPMNRMRFISEEKGKALQIEETEKSDVASMTMEQMLPGL